MAGLPCIVRKFEARTHILSPLIYAARSYKKVDDRTLEFTVKKDGKVTTTGKIVVSADGKSRTVTTTGTDSKGNKISTTAVYDKQ